MRVIAGIARSLPLKTPVGMETRPTTDRIKETLFNMIQNRLQDCVFVDLFSGSGGIGIEAISRGAKRSYFVDNAPKAISCINENLAFTKLTQNAIVIRQDVILGLNNISDKQVDIIFMDPPYQLGLEEKVLLQLRNFSYVTEHTLIIVEALLDTNFDYLEEYGFVLEKEKRYKTNKHLFLRKKEME